MNPKQRCSSVGAAGARKSRLHAAPTELCRFFTEFYEHAAPTALWIGFRALGVFQQAVIEKAVGYTTTEVAECAGGAAEISRWWSESASGNHRNPAQNANPSRRDDGATRAPCNSIAPAGAGSLSSKYPVVLARGLASPPANFRGASGTVWNRVLWSLCKRLISKVTLLRQRGCVCRRESSPDRAPPAGRW